MLTLLYNDQKNYARAMRYMAMLAQQGERHPLGKAPPYFKKVKNMTDARTKSVTETATNIVDAADVTDRRGAMYLNRDGTYLCVVQCSYSNHAGDANYSFFIECTPEEFEQMQDDIANGDTLTSTHHQETKDVVVYIHSVEALPAHMYTGRGNQFLCGVSNRQRQLGLKRLLQNNKDRKDKLLEHLKHNEALAKLREQCKGDPRAEELLKDYENGIL